MLQGWPARQHTGRCEVSREVAAWSGHGSKGLSHFVAALSGLRREFLGHLSTALSELWRSILRTARDLATGSSIAWALADLHLYRNLDI